MMGRQAMMVRRVTVGLLVLLSGLPAIAQQDKPAAARRTPVVEVFEKTRDAVVNIAATQVFETTVPSLSLFDSFFGINPDQPRTERYTSTSLGSGFVLHPEGYVVTNAHVVAQAASEKVIFADKSEYEAELVAADEFSDLAVLKIKPKAEGARNFPALALGRSDDLLIGETVIAIGNPLGYQHTVTAGIVSALDRQIQLGQGKQLRGLIQTDASINRGNSGGPLLNILGELIGINTAIRGDAQNICFAIPVDTLRKVLPDMLSIERRKRLEIGLKLSWRGKLYVVGAVGPAAEAGIQPGDELLSVNDAPLRHDIDYHIHMLHVNTGEQLEYKLRRDGRLITATLKPRAIPIPDGATLMREKFGMGIRLLTAKERESLDLKTGMIITSIEHGSPADRTGLETGMIVVQIGNQFPADLDDVGLLLERVRPRDQVTFRVWRIERRFIRVYAATLTAR